MFEPSATAQTLARFPTSHQLWSTPPMRAIQVNKDDSGYNAQITELDDSQLPEGDVTVQVDASTLNYKDSLYYF